MQQQAIFMSDLVPALWALVVMIGGALAAMVMWTGKRLQENVDMLPGLFSDKMKEHHDEMISKVDAIGATQKELERDVRANNASLDRRMVAVEVRCGLFHGEFTQQRTQQ